MLHLSWVALESLARQLVEPGARPGSIPEAEWRVISQTLDALLTEQNWLGVLRLRRTFTALFARDTFWGLAVLKRLDDEAIAAAKQIEDQLTLAHLLGARGHNFHRQGFHLEAIELFEEAAAIHHEVGMSFPVLKNTYMTALCYRALGDRKRSREILTNVLEQVDETDPWRGNPLQVLGWLARDQRRWTEAEAFLREALFLQERAENPDILVAGTLADLGEILGLQGRLSEGEECFKQSLAILRHHEGQYDRQEARTRVKLAEFLIRAGQHRRALHLLNEADDKVRGYGHYYDLMWHIELAKCLIYFRQGRLRQALRKFRAFWNYRRVLGLTPILLVRPVLSQWLNINLLRRSSNQ